MEFEKIRNIFSIIGEKVSFIFGKIITFTANLGLNLNQLQIKIISLIILLVLFFIILKFVNIMKKPVKWSILLLILILILSIIFSF